MAHERSAEEARLRILCVDDEALIGEVVTRILESRLDCHVEYAASASDALRLIAATDFDALVVDYVMPGMNGGRFYRQVLRRWPDLATRILFITGDTLMPKTLEAITRTGRPYLIKPFSLPDLTRAMEELLPDATVGDVFTTSQS
jgi:CheY-like chemotaxis protein